MSKKDIDKNNLKISVIPPPESTLKTVDDVFIVITQAFCPNGHNIVNEGNDKFDGFPGLKILTTCDDDSGEVTLSPFHGDSSKSGKLDWKHGTHLNLLCPECRTPFEKLANCKCESNGDLVKLYLSPSLSDSHILGVCSVWGCRRSHTIDNFQIISEFLEGNIDN